MAETFSEGLNKIWYRAANFNSEEGITVRLHKPDDTDDGPISVPQCCEPGIYCLEYNFDQLGAWIGVFFEDDTKTSSSIFNIVPKIDPSVPYEGEYMKCETCVHFTRVSGKDYGKCDRVIKGNPYRRIDDTCPSYQDKSTG